MTTYPTPSPTWAVPTPVWAAPTAPLNPLFRVNPWDTSTTASMYANMAQPAGLQPNQVMNTLGIPTTIPPEATPESLDAEIQVGLAKLQTVNPDLAATMRSQYTGLPKEDSGGFFGGVMDVVGAIGGGVMKGVMGALELIGRTAYIVPQWFDPEDTDPWYTDIGQALLGRDKTNWNEVFQHLGWEDEGFMGVVRSTVGLGLDIITDPMTWATLGAGSMTAPATRAGTAAKLLATRYRGFVDDAVRLGWASKERASNVLLETYQRFAGQALQKGAAITKEMTEEAAQMLAGQAGRAVMEADRVLVQHMFEAASEVYLSVYNRNFGRFLAKGGELVVGEGATARTIATKDIRDLLEAAVRAGNGNKELWAAAREASGALGGIRFGYAIPFTNLRYLSPMLPMSNVFSPLARMGRFAAGLSVTKRAEALLKAGEATWADLALIQRTGYSALKDGDQHAKVLYQKLTDSAGRLGTGFWTASELAGKATGWFSPGAKQYRMGLGYYFAESKAKELRGLIANLRNHVLYDTVDEGTATQRQVLMRNLEDVWHISERVRKDTATPEERYTFAKWLDWFGGTDAPVEAADVQAGKLDQWFWENVGNPALNRSADAEGQVDEALRNTLTGKLEQYKATAMAVQGEKLNVARQLSAVQGRGREVLNKYGVMVRDTTYANLRDTKVINRKTVPRFQSGTSEEYKRSFWMNRRNARGLDDRAVGTTTSRFAGIEATARPTAADDVEVVFNPRKVLVLGDARGEALARGTDAPIAEEILDEVKKLVDDLKAKETNIGWTAQQWDEFEQGLATQALHNRGGVDFDAIYIRGAKAEDDRIIMLGNKEVMPWEMGRVVSEIGMDVRQSSGFLHRVFHPELKRWLHGDVPLDEQVIVHRVRDLRAKALRGTAGLDLEDSELAVRQVLDREMRLAGTSEEHIAQLWAKDEAGNYIMPIWETDPLKVHNDYVNVVSEGVAGSLLGEFTEGMDALGRVSPAFMGRAINIDRAVGFVDEKMVKNVARLLAIDEKAPLIQAMNKYIRRREIYLERAAEYRQTHLERVRRIAEEFGRTGDFEEAVRSVGDGDPELERMLAAWTRFDEAYAYEKKRITDALAHLGEEEQKLQMVEEFLGLRSWEDEQWKMLKWANIRPDSPGVNGNLELAYAKLKEKAAESLKDPGSHGGWGLAVEATEPATWEAVTRLYQRAKIRNSLQLMDTLPNGDKVYALYGSAEEMAAREDPHFVVMRTADDGTERAIASRKGSTSLRDASGQDVISIEEARELREAGPPAGLPREHRHTGGHVTSLTSDEVQGQGYGTILLHTHWKWLGVSAPGDLGLMWSQGSWSPSGALLQLSAGRKYMENVLHIPNAQQLWDMLESRELGIYRDGTVTTRAGAPRVAGKGGASHIMSREAIESSEAVAMARLRALEQAKARRLDATKKALEAKAEAAPAPVGEAELDDALNRLVEGKPVRARDLPTEMSTADIIAAADPWHIYQNPPRLSEEDLQWRRPGEPAPPGSYYTGRPEEFADQLSQEGIKEPVVMWYDPDTGEYFMHEGHHRALAAERAGIEGIEVRWEAHPEEVAKRRDNLNLLETAGRDPNNPLPRISAAAEEEAQAATFADVLAEHGPDVQGAWDTNLDYMKEQNGVGARTREIHGSEVTFDVTHGGYIGRPGGLVFRAYRMKGGSRELLGFLFQDNEGRIFTWVRPDWRRRGIGTELFSITEDWSSKKLPARNPLGAMRDWVEGTTQGANLWPVLGGQRLTATPTEEGLAWANRLVPPGEPPRLTAGAQSYADEVSAAIESLATQEAPESLVRDIFLPARVARAEKGVSRDLGKLRKEVSRAAESHAKRTADEAVKLDRAKRAMMNADREVMRVETQIQDATLKDAISFEAVSPPGGRAGWVAVNIPGLDNVWMHPYVAEEFNHVLGLHGNRVSGFRRYWREWLLGPWKKWATYRSPGFHVRNLMGGVWNNMLGGVNIADYHFAHRVNVARDGGKWRDRLVKDYGDWERVNLAEVPGMRGMRDTLTYGQLGDMLSDQGIGRANATAVAMVGDFEDALKLSTKGKATGLARKVDARLRRFSTTVEDFLRVAAWSGGMRATAGDLYGSRAFVMLRHGDYEDLTDAEDFIRDLVPFYKWMRTNLPYQVKSLLEKPGVMATTLKLERYVAEVQGLDPTAMESATPEWMKRAFTIPIPGSGALQGDNPVDYIGLDLPYGDLYKGGREYFSSFLPVVSDIVESTILKQDVFMGKPLGEKMVAAGGLWSLPGFKQLLQALPGTTEVDGVVYIPDTYDNVLSGVPIYGRFRNWLSGDENRVQARWSTLASFFGGVGYRAADLTADEESYLYDIMMPTLARYRSMGVVFPDKDQLVEAGLLMQAEGQPFDTAAAWPDGVVGNINQMSGTAA